MILILGFLVLECTLRTVIHPVRHPSVSTSHLLTRALLATTFILISEPTYYLAPASTSPAVLAECQRIFRGRWNQLSYGQCYIVLMRMSRTETEEGELGHFIRERIRDLLANKEFKESLDGQLACIAIHLQQPVCVQDSEEAEVTEGVLEEFLPVYDSNRPWMIRVSARRHYEGSITYTGTIRKLFTRLSKTKSFEQILRLTQRG